MVLAAELVAERAGKEVRVEVEDKEAGLQREECKRSKGKPKEDSGFLDELCSLIYSFCSPEDKRRVYKSPRHTSETVFGGYESVCFTFYCLHGYL